MKLLIAGAVGVFGFVSAVAADAPRPVTMLTHVVNAYAVYSPDGKTIAYQSNATGNWELYLMDADGQNVRRLTNHPAADITPVFSPDGAKIAFCSEREGHRDVFVMNADGAGDPTRLTTDPGNDLHPFFNADGSKILFSSNRGKAEAADFDIYVMNADGTDQHQITSGPEIDTYASFSPDGKRIVTRRVIDGGANNEIFVMNADGSDAKNLTNDASAYDGWPVWSPDGKRIAFASGQPGRGNHHVYLINPDGGGRVRLTPDYPGTQFGYYTQPSFSADGTRLLCTMYRPPARESSEIVRIELPAAG